MTRVTRKVDKILSPLKRKNVERGAIGPEKSAGSDIEKIGLRRKSGRGARRECRFEIETQKQHSISRFSQNSPIKEDRSVASAATPKIQFSCERGSGGSSKD